MRTPNFKVATRNIPHTPIQSAFEVNSTGDLTPKEGEPKGLMVMDSNGDLMPGESVVYDNYIEIDGNGDLCIIGV